MYRTLCRLSTVTLILIVAACGKSNETVKPQTPPPAPPKETVFDDLVSNKERAKQTTDQAAEQNRVQLEAAMKESGVDAAP